jgi:hypothetical protein
MRCKAIRNANMIEVNIPKDTVEVRAPFESKKAATLYGSGFTRNNKDIANPNRAEFFFRPGYQIAWREFISPP